MWKARPWDVSECRFLFLDLKRTVTVISISMPVQAAFRITLCQQFSSFCGTEFLGSEYILQPIVELLRDRTQLPFPSWIFRCHSSSCTADTRKQLEGRYFSENAHRETFLPLPLTSSTEKENIIAEAGKVANGRVTFATEPVIAIKMAERKIWVFNIKGIMTLTK